MRITVDQNLAVKQQRYQLEAIKMISALFGVFLGIAMVFIGQFPVDIFGVFVVVIVVLISLAFYKPKLKNKY